MILSIQDSMKKTLYINPQFVSLIKDTGRGYRAVYDIAGNMSYVSDPKEIAKLVQAVAECQELIQLPTKAPALGLPFNLVYGADSADDGIEDGVADTELEEMLENLPPPPPKSPKRAKKSTKA